jgi:GDPmannose 4,6-dehydratase
LDVAAERLDLDWNKYVEIDPRYFRPTEVDYLLGDPSKALAAFGWSPNVSFRELVQMMVDHDLQLARREQMVAEAGYSMSGR